jgi:lipid II:glycine glycyltransferase (peptidoglycan interpeptide bridge formation enzyme)
MALETMIDSITEAEWQCYALDFADYSIYQTWAYQEVRAAMAQQQVSRFVIKDNTGQVVTMGQVRIKHAKLLGLKIGYVQWGPLTRGRDGTMKCTIEALRQVIATYLDNKLNVLRVVPNARDDESGIELVNILRASGFEKVPGYRPYHTFMVLLDESKEEMLSRLHRDCRRVLRKVEKLEIDVKEGTDEESFNILESLYAQTRQRKGFKGPDSQEFSRTQKMLAESEKAKILIAYYGNEPVTAHATTHFGDMAIPIITASNQKGLKYGTSYLLWWKAYQQAKDLRMKYYDLGGCDEKKTPKMYLFKKRMGGSEVYYIGAYEVCTGPMVRSIWRGAEKVYNFIKK